MENFKIKAKTIGHQVNLQALEIIERKPIIRTIARYQHYKLGEKILVKVL